MLVICAWKVPPCRLRYERLRAIRLHVGCMTSQDALYHQMQDELVDLWLVGRVTNAGTRDQRCRGPTFRQPRLP